MILNIPPPIDPNASENQPIDLWNIIGPPPFPMGVMPQIIEDFAIVMANHMGTDASGIAMAALTVASAAIDVSTGYFSALRVNLRWVASIRSMPN